MDRSSSQTNATPHPAHLAYSSSCSLPRTKTAPSTSDVKRTNGRSTHSLPPPPSIKYIAFYNAVEHELSPVTSGYRVSLTYNLYYDDAPLPTGPLRGDGVTEEEANLRQILSTLIGNLDFLPDGGYLGFGLRYQYPIKTESSDLGSLVGALKGSDAVIKRVADELNMNAQLKLIYENEDEEEDWDGDSDNEEEEDADEEQEEGSRTRWILLDDANQYPQSILEDDDSVKVSVASSGGVILCKPDKKVRFNQVSLSYHLSKLTGKLVGRTIHGLRRLHRQPSKSLLGNSTHEVLESKECICEIWKPCECRVYLWGFVFDG